VDVGDATGDDRFSRDPYFTGITCCSLLAVPILSRGALRAVLLLENRLIRAAFTTGRLDAVNLIAAQLAVSLDNAQLYAEFRRIADEQAALRRVAVLVAQAAVGYTQYFTHLPALLVEVHILGATALVIGFVFDAFLENILIHWGMYIYSQVIPWGSIFTGTTFQFPLIWESFSVCFVMVPAAILCYRDDTGKSVAEKLAAKAKLFPTRPVLGTFLVMFAIINVSYFAYGAWFWVIKVSHAATSVACPWPYPEAKVYDPQGYYEKAGAQGPYSVGIWSTWASGEPNGRPHVDPPPPGQGACASKNG